MNNTAALADRLGDLRAKIKFLQTEEESLKKQLDFLSDGEVIVGNNYMLKKTEYLSERIDTAKVDKHFGGKDAAKNAGFYKISVTDRLTTTAIVKCDEAAA